jgi:hypothetical protein
MKLRFVGSVVAMSVLASSAATATSVVYITSSPAVVAAPQYVVASPQYVVASPVVTTAPSVVYSTTTTHCEPRVVYYSY